LPRNIEQGKSHLDTQITLIASFSLGAALALLAWSPIGALLAVDPCCALVQEQEESEEHRVSIPCERPERLQTVALLCGSYME